MKFIIDTHNLEVSKSMIETLLENELDNPISVKKVEEINAEKLNKLAYDSLGENLDMIYEGYSSEDTYQYGFKEGYRKAKEE